MRDMEDRMGREASTYQDTISRLEEDIAKMKASVYVFLFFLLGRHLLI